MTLLDEAIGLLREVQAAFSLNGFQPTPDSIMGRINVLLEKMVEEPVYDCWYTCNICGERFSGPKQGASCPHHTTVVG